MDQNVERRIRDRAYSIWEEEGCPSGRDVDHWLRAAQEVAAEEGRGESLKDAGGSAANEPQEEASGNSVTAAAEEEKPKKARTARASKAKGADSQKAEKGAEPAPKARRSKAG